MLVSYCYYISQRLSSSAISSNSATTERQQWRGTFLFTPVFMFIPQHNQGPVTNPRLGQYHKLHFTGGFSSRIVHRWAGSDTKSKAFDPVRVTEITGHRTLYWAPGLICPTLNGPHISWQDQVYFNDMSLCRKHTAYGLTQWNSTPHIKYIMFYGLFNLHGLANCYWASLEKSSLQ